MKKLILATIGSIVMLSGSAFAGCLNDSHAAAEPDTSWLASVDESDSAILARLKAQEEAEQLEKLPGSSPTFN